MSLPPVYDYTTPFFYLQMTQKKTVVHLKMELFSQTLRTGHYPSTYDILSSQFPSVLRTACFNDANLPFHQEVRDTEIGHLFEHILLESLCLEQLKQRNARCSFTGKTSWNWQKEKLGVFHIRIFAGEKTLPFFPRSLQWSIALMTHLIEQGERQKVRPLPLFELSALDSHQYPTLSLARI